MTLVAQLAPKGILAMAGLPTISKAFSQCTNPADAKALEAIVKADKNRPGQTIFPGIGGDCSVNAQAKNESSYEFNGHTITGGSRVLRLEISPKGSVASAQSDAVRLELKSVVDLDAGKSGQRIFKPYQAKSDVIQTAPLDGFSDGVQLKLLAVKSDK
jgi:hypothetical protein